LQVEHFALHIVEKGTMVNEEVDVDVEDQTEVIRVPQHNDVDAVEVVHDFASVSLEFWCFWTPSSCPGMWHQNENLLDLFSVCRCQ